MENDLEIARKMIRLTSKEEERRENVSLSVGVQLTLTVDTIGHRRIKKDRWPKCA